MQVQWCWRCKIDIPMVDDAEWSQIWAKRNNANPFADRQGMLDEYERLTGFRETNANAMFHHLISIYGPPCPRCGKVLRTPVACKCFECGQVVHDPDWSFLFTVDDTGQAAGRGTFVTADFGAIDGRLSVGDGVDIWSGQTHVARAIVEAIEHTPDATGKRSRTRIWFDSRVPPVAAGHTVRISPPRRGAERRG